MRPALARDDTRSSAERAIFDRIRDDLDDSWVGLHSLGLVTHPRKPWAEIDFVLVGPPGIFSLEVKGQRVSRRDGQWVFTNRHGVETVKQEGPFEQVGSASAALRNYIVARLPPIRRALVGFGVVTPDMTFDIEGPDIEPLLVYDERDAARPLSRYLDRLVDYWNTRIHQHDGARHLSPDEVNGVVELLRPDFDGVPSLRGVTQAVNAELLRLTTEQYRVLDGLVDNDRAFVRGGAGTGKTLLAAQEARRQARLGRRVLFCCFNRNLSDQVEDWLSDEPLVLCRNLHRLMASVVADAGLERELPNASQQDLFAVFYPQLSQAAMRKPDVFIPFDVLVVDESQDLLRDAYLDVLDAALAGGLGGGRWRMFFDPRQNLFDGTEAVGIRRIDSFSPARFRLTLNCRNTTPVATATSLLTDTASDETLVSEGPETTTYWYANMSEQAELLGRDLRRLLSGGIAPDDIVILSHKSFADSHIPQAVIDRFRVEEKKRPSHGSIRFATSGSFKGLEADAVLVISVDDLTSAEARRHLYVSTSRARVFLTVFVATELSSTYGELAFRFGQRLMPRQKHATVSPS